MVAAPFNILNERARELLAARTSLAAYAIAQNPDYELASHLQILIDHLEALERGEIKNLMVFMPPRHGKPLAKSTPVLMATGEYLPLGEIKEGHRVISDTGEPRRVMEVHDQGLLPILEISTKSGRAVRAAFDHPFMTPDGWRLASALRVGQVLALVGSARIWQNSRHSPAEGRLLGYFIGDGQCTDNRRGSLAANITNFDEGIARSIRETIAEMGFVLREPALGRFQLSGGVRDWLRETGIAGQDSHTKRVPEWVFRSENKVIAAFLAAYYDCDGSIVKKGLARNDCCIELYSIQRPLLEDVQHLLLRFGINSLLRIKPVKYNGEAITSWRLSISDRHNCALFRERIPLRGEKAKRLEEWKPEKKIFRAEYIPDEIVSIRELPAEECRCLDVYRDHTFTANDIVVHNSETCTKLFPSWYLGRHPERLVILSSYSQELVEDFAQDCRDFIRSEFHSTVFPECVIDESVSARHDFRTTRKGGVRSVGKGGSITGRGGDLIVLDDIVKDKQEATSEAEQRKIRQWFSTTIIQRRSPITRMLLIMTRWDPEDVAGWQLDTYAKGWKVLELPAIAERDEGWRKEGEALWPERFDIDWLEDQREQMPRDDWLALYQQRPTRDGDERVFLDDWFQIFTPRKDLADAKLMNGEMIVDPAGSKRKKSDRTAIWVIGMAADRNYYFFDGVCDRLGLKERWETLKALHKKWAPNFRRLRTWYEEFGLMADREYITEKQNSEGYRFYVERIGDTHVPKPVLIRNFGRGVCQDKRVFFNKSIPRTIEGVRVNLTEWFYDHEWKRYPALRHEDLLNSAAYVTDPKIGQGFPTGKKEGSVQEMLDSWAKRQKRITPMGA